MTTTTSLQRLYTEEVSGRISKKKAGEIVEFAVDSLGDVLRQGEVLRVRGFGQFKVRVRPAHRGGNPRTGVAMDIPARTTVAFKPGPDLKAAVAGSGTVHVPGVPAAFWAFWRDGKFDLPRQDFDSELALVFQCLADALVRHETVRLGRLAIMRAVERPARAGYHPVKKVKVAVPATWAVKFSPGVQLKALVKDVKPK